MTDPHPTRSPKPIVRPVRPVRRVDVRIGRVYVWSARAPLASGARDCWAPPVDYMMASIRAFCAKWN